MFDATSSVKNLIVIIANEMISLKDELTAIDSKLGDGDLGLSMEKGGQALKQVCKTDYIDNATFLATAAVAFNRAAPSTMGTLISYGIQEVAKYFKEKQEISESDIVLIPRMFFEIISKRGKAKLGDKTILDALIPYANELEKTYEATGELCIALDKAAESAKMGMEKTKGMVAKIGRAKWLAERNKDYPDGGAVLCSRIADCLVRNFSKLS